MESKSGEHRLFKVRVDASGRIVIPAEAKLRQKVREGQTVLMEEEGDGLHLRTMEDVVRDAQRYFKSVIPKGVSLVDELIAERREEAKRE